MFMEMRQNAGFTFRLITVSRAQKTKICYCLMLGAVANLRGCGREAAAVLFWVHIFAVFSMAAWIVLFLNILF